MVIFGRERGGELHEGEGSDPRGVTLSSDGAISMDTIVQPLWYDVSTNTWIPGFESMYISTLPKLQAPLRSYFGLGQADIAKKWSDFPSRLVYPRCPVTQLPVHGKAHFLTLNPFRVRRFAIPPSIPHRNYQAKFKSKPTLEKGRVGADEKGMVQPNFFLPIALHQLPLCLARLVTA
jgi:hypothetical protein